MTQNKKLYFIRHGKLLLPYKNHEDMPMKILADLASTKINPPIDKMFLNANINKLEEVINLNELDVIYASPSKRCQQTAEFIQNFITKNSNRNIDIEVLSELKEVKFDLNKIYENEKKFYFKNLNEDVFNAMISGVGSESIKVIQKRVDKIMEKINHDITGEVLIITHDFVMRVIEIYIKNKGANKDIVCADLKNTHRNDYLRGFKTNSNYNELSTIGFN